MNSTSILSLLIWFPIVGGLFIGVWGETDGVRCRGRDGAHRTDENYQVEVYLAQG